MQTKNLISLIKEYEKFIYYFDAELGFKDYPSHFSIKRLIDDHEIILNLSKEIIDIINDKTDNVDTRFKEIKEILNPNLS